MSEESYVTNSLLLLSQLYTDSVDEAGEFHSGMEITNKDTRKTSERTLSTYPDSAKMPPPKIPSSAHSSIKKRKSKRSLDYGSGSNGNNIVGSFGAARSAPVTPTSDRSLSKVRKTITGV